MLSVLRTQLNDKWLRHWPLTLVFAYGTFGVAQVIHRLISIWMQKTRSERLLRRVPQARYKPGLHGYVTDMLGNLLRLHEWRAEITEGLPVSKMLGPTNVLMVRDPLVVRHFLKDAFSKYTKPLPHSMPVQHYFTKWLGDGIFTTPHGTGAPDGGKSWLLQRKIASQIFSRGNFNTLMQEVFEAKAVRLRKVLAQHCDDHSPVDLQLHFFNYTMDSILKIFFGQDSDTAAGVPNKYGQAFDEAHHTMFSHAIKSLPFATMCHMFLPWPFGGYNGIACRLRDAYSPTFRRFQAANQVLDEESLRMIHACRKDPNLAQRRDLLALFVRAEEKELFSDVFLRDMVLNMVIAGRDTTACTLSWMFYALATNPDIQKQLVLEVDEKLPPGKQLTPKSLTASEMPYLNGVLYETLRLWPPVPSDSKVAAEDDVLPDGTRVPKGTQMVFLPFAVGRDRERYPEPETVRPERWIPFTAPDPYSFPVFQAGPRICLGMDMAIFEAKVVAVELLRYYHVQLCSGQADEITYGRKFTMAINNAKSTGGDSEKLWVELQWRAGRVPNQTHGGA
jgi:cytochrome P450